MNKKQHRQKLHLRSSPVPRFLSSENLIAKKKASSLSLHVCIISWTGMHENAVSIAKSLIPYTNNITTIYSDKNDNFYLETVGDAIKTNDALFWGDKFCKAINSNDADVSLIIHADCRSKDWRLVADCCKNAFEHDSTIGIWSPLTNGTDFPLNLTALHNTNQLSFVAYIEGIVFALRKNIIARMREFDYTKNKYGWGIDWAASAIAFSMGLNLVVDHTVEIEHPKIRGYDGKEAKNQSPIFLAQMSANEKLIFQLIRTKIRYQRLLREIKIKNPGSTPAL